jgi:hypothetical protein
MAQAKSVHSTPPTNTSKTRPAPTAFLNAVARIHLSHLFQDPFLRAAFRAAEDDGLATALVEIDRPRILDGGAAERVPAMAEG